MSAPPSLHLSFELEAEQLAVVIRGCSAFVYLPDLSAVDLAISADATVEPTEAFDATTAAGHWVLRAEASATTPAILVGVRLVHPHERPDDDLPS